jgi:hypothetical protein
MENPTTTTFATYIEQLPTHKSLLLLDYKFLVGDAHSVCTRLTMLRDAILVTDGGAAADFGSFGWVLGLVDGTRLAQGSGVVYGHDPKSYRAEALGAKAGSLLFQFCDHQLSWDDAGFQYYCDNKGLLRKLTVFCNHDNALNATFCVGHCVVNSLYTFYLPMDAISFQLQLPSLMNIEPDSSRPMVPFDPATGTMLSITGSAITRNIETTLHHHKHTAPILDYY